MDYLELNQFIDDSLKKWAQIKRGFSDAREMSDYLEKAYPVAMFDDYQLDLRLAKNLYKPVYNLNKEEKDITPEERKREEFRQKMVLHYEKSIKEISLEVRFPSVKIEFIQELKIHPLIKDLNSLSRASIKVTIEHKNIGR